jgi:hypothetical protein
MPVRYRARVYGETKISRFTHGWLLLKMTGYGFMKLRLNSPGSRRAPKDGGVSPLP